MNIPSTLATRYASDAMCAIWAPEAKIINERRLWIAVLKAQQALGLSIDASVISAYEKVIHNVDLASIDKREQTLRHDVKARIEEFNALAGHQVIHMGMTSRDLTESVEILQLKSALTLTRDKYVALLAGFARRAGDFIDQPITGRSHNVPAQVTTVGKRFATFAEEGLFALSRIEDLLSRLPMRGIKGPVGTAQDALDLFEGDKKKLADLDRNIATHLGFENILDSVGQIYPRSIDFDVVSALLQLAAAPSNMAITLRLMAGAELATEGFQTGQVGSSAMPHKMNARSSERINGFTALLRGYSVAVSELSGAQWNEGDVACSVVRRVALPDAFYAMDGLLETALTVIDELGIFKGAIDAELERNLPFLATTKILMAAVKKGVGREIAHEIIKEHSLAAVAALRGGAANDLLHRLANDSRLPLDLQELQALIARPLDFTGVAKDQTLQVIARVSEVAAQHQKAASYRPGAIR